MKDVTLIGLKSLTNVWLGFPALGIKRILASLHTRGTCAKAILALKTLTISLLYALLQEDRKHPISS